MTKAILIAVCVMFSPGAGTAASQAQTSQRSGQSFQANAVGYAAPAVGVGRTAFPIPGAVPAGEPYDPYRLPYTYDWPYGYGYTAR